MSIKFILLSENAKLPTRATPCSSGLDLYSPETTIIKSKTKKIIDLEIKCIIPSGYDVQIRSRSGLAYNNSIFVLNSPGTIDQDYTGNIKIILFNLSNEDYIINKHDRIAQIVICPIIMPNIEQVESYTTDITNKRKENGFGSTGK
mgnify:FL=1